MNKTFYTCATNWVHNPDFKVYKTLEDLKRNEPCWDECGIYELSLAEFRCVVEPNLFGDLDCTDLNIENPEMEPICGDETEEVAKGFLEKVVQTFKSTPPKLDWVDHDGKKQFDWEGKCDACGKKKNNLTVIHSSTLSGVTICRDCKMGGMRE